MFRSLTRALAIAACLFAPFTWALAQQPHWPDSIAIGTASQGGTYFAYGEALARLLTRELKTTVWARPTEGPSENIKLLEAGEIQLAFVTMGIAQQAWYGSNAWTGGKSMRRMRAIFPMYDTPFQIMVVQDSRIGLVADLGAKKIGIGPAGGTTASYAAEIFKVLKVEPSLQRGAWADLAEEVRAGRLDGLLVAAGVPFPSFATLERQIKVRYVPLTTEQIVNLRLAMPELGASTVAAGSYPSLQRNYQTIGMFNFAVAHENLPDDLVYAIMGAVFAYQAELMESQPAAAETTPSNFTRNTFLPFHRGAQNWYEKNAVSSVIRGD